MKIVSVVVAASFLAALALPAGAAAPPRKNEVARLKRQVAALEAKVRRLTSEKRALTQANASALRRERALARRVAAVDPCPVTKPNGSSPPGPTFGAEFHGNGAIWVGAWPANVVLSESRADGSIAAKFGWWRAVTGRLEIAGRRLDGPASPLTANVPDGYGDSGFQSSLIVFPSAGCWEVTGRVGHAQLTFVTLVLAV